MTRTVGSTKRSRNEERKGVENADVDLSARASRSGLIPTTSADNSTSATMHPAHTGPAPGVGSQKGYYEAFLLEDLAKYQEVLDDLKCSSTSVRSAISALQATKIREAGELVLLKKYMEDREKFIQRLTSCMELKLELVVAGEAREDAKRRAQLASLAAGERKPRYMMSMGDD